MRIRFNEISPNGNQFTIDDPAEIGDADLSIQDGTMEATFVLRRKDEHKVEMSGALKLTPVLCCDRCLGSYAYPLETEYHILFETIADSKWNLKELECGSEDLDTVLLEEPEIDLIDVLRQQVALSLPDKKLCSEQCRGICSHCGANRNTEQCNCAQNTVETPFAILSKLKK
ncbi:YceD family protein [Desulfogranum mediterraneum]|uniref:YceD family protein n=1 Tax=Desulfogranum mediterraneum TaxID=160661 RepID=UPI00040A74C8|nr:DUF177 domain-containing protein [Desulfogranum mediterraneum]